MSQSHDYCGKFVLNAGASGSAGSALNEVIIPCRRGSGWVRPRNADSEEYTVGGILEPIAWTIGDSMPRLRIRTHCFTNWFTVPWLKKMLGLPVADATNRPATTGFLPDLGKFYYQYGSRTAKVWTSTKLDSILLRWGLSGDAIEADLIFVPYGPRLTSVALNGATPIIGKPYFQGKGISYVGTWDKVHGGSLQFFNRLSGDFSTPAQANTLASDPTTYAKGLFNGMLNFQATVMHDSDESLANSDWEANVVSPELDFAFKDPDWTTGSPASGVKFALFGLAPDERETIGHTVSLTTKSFSNIKSGSGATSAAVSAMVAGDA